MFKCSETFNKYCYDCLGQHLVNHIHKCKDCKLIFPDSDSSEKLDSD